MRALQTNIYRQLLQCFDSLNLDQFLQNVDSKYFIEQISKQPQYNDEPATNELIIIKEGQLQEQQFYLDKYYLKDSQQNICQLNQNDMPDYQICDSQFSKMQQNFTNLHHLSKKSNDKVELKPQNLISYRHLIQQDRINYISKNIMANKFDDIYRSQYEKIFRSSELQKTDQNKNTENDDNNLFKVNIIIGEQQSALISSQNILSFILTGITQIPDILINKFTDHPLKYQKQWYKDNYQKQQQKYFEQNDSSLTIQQQIAKHVHIHSNNQQQESYSIKIGKILANIIYINQISDLNKYNIKGTKNVIILQTTDKEFDEKILKDSLLISFNSEKDIKTFNQMKDKIHIINIQDSQNGNINEKAIETFWSKIIQFL